MTDKQLRAAHFREAASFFEETREDVLHNRGAFEYFTSDQVNTVLDALDSIALNIEAAAPLPDGYVCIPRAWLEEAVKDFEEFEQCLDGYYRKDGPFEGIIQKWKERAKQP